MTDFTEAGLRSADDTPNFYIVAFERHSISFCHILSDRFMLVKGGRVARRRYTEEDTISKFVFIPAKEIKCKVTFLVLAYKYVSCITQFSSDKLSIEKSITHLNGENATHA